MSTKLILIRHGETVWNYKRRYSGCKDIGLSKKGRRQAERLRSRLKGESIDNVYASNRKRAIQTARIIFDRSKKIEEVADLREIHFGLFEGLSHKELLKRFGDIYEKWLSDPYQHHAPQGEKLKDFKKRVLAAFRKIVLLNPARTVAVVSHGGSIAVFLTYILKRKNFWKHIPHPASISIIEYKNRRMHIRLLDDTAHLNG